MIGFGPAESSAASAAGGYFRRQHGCSGLSPCKHRIWDPPFRVSTAVEIVLVLSTGRRLGLPLVLAAAPAPAALPTAPARRSPAVHRAGALCFTASEAYGSEAVRCGAGGRERCSTVEGGEAGPLP